MKKNIAILVVLFLFIGAAAAQLVWPTESKGIVFKKFGPSIESVKTPDGFSVTPAEVSQMFEPRKFLLMIYANETDYFVVRYSLWQSYEKTQKYGVKINGKTGLVERENQDIKVLHTYKEMKMKKTFTKNAIEDFDGCRIEVEGIYLEYAVPTLEVTSHTVGNGRNIVRLKLNELSMQKIGKDKIWFGDKVVVAGTVKAKNMKVPEILVEDIQRKP